MTKRLISVLIAGLYAAAPAFAQSDDPMRVEGTGTVGYINNDTNAFDNAKLNEYQDLSNGVLSNIGLRGRSSKTWFEGYGENFGRTDQYMFLRGGMYDVFKAGAYLNDIPHMFSSNAYSPYGGIGGNLLTATFPLGALPNPSPPGNWSNFTLGYDRRDWGGFAEWQRNSPWYFRVDGNQVSFSGTKVGSAANGTSPGNGFVDLAFPTAVHDRQLGAEAGYQSGKATFAVRWDYSKFDNDNETLQWTNPYFGGNQLDTHVPAAGQHVQQVHALGQLPRPAVALGRVRALHLVEDDERLRARADRAQHGRASSPRRCRTRTISTASTSTRRSRCPGPRCRPPTSTRACTTTGPSSRTTRRSSTTATRRRSRSPPASAAATSSARTACRRRSSATARTSSTTTPRTTSASTCGGSSRAATGWAAAGTTTTSTRRGSTTTSRTGTNSGSSTRTPCSTRSPAGSSTSTSSATRRPT